MSGISSLSPSYPPTPPTPLPIADLNFCMLMKKGRPVTARWLTSVPLDSAVRSRDRMVNNTDPLLLLLRSAFAFHCVGCMSRLGDFLTLGLADLAPSEIKTHHSQSTFSVWLRMFWSVCCLYVDCGVHTQISWNTVWVDVFLMLLPSLILSLVFLCVQYSKWRKMYNLLVVAFFFSPHSVRFY